MAMTQVEAQELFRVEPDDYIEVGSSAAAYRRVGAGPDVLFVHGWPANGATFRRLLPHLVDHVTCHLIDMPGTGSSRWTDPGALSIDNHVETVRRVVDELELTDMAVVGHDSGGMIARHALAGDPRVRSFGLVNTEQPQGLNWRFKLFLSSRNLPAVGKGLGFLISKPSLRRNGFVLGDAFADRSQIDTDFDEFILGPLVDSQRHQEAAVTILKSFDEDMVTELGALHRKIDVPVQLVWGDKDPFFPLDKAIEMVDTFPNAKIAIVEGGGLFVHEECAEATAAGLLPVLTRNELVDQIPS